MNQGFGRPRITLNAMLLLALDVQERFNYLLMRLGSGSGDPNISQQGIGIYCWSSRCKIIQCVIVFKTSVSWNWNLTPALINYGSTTQRNFSAFHVYPNDLEVVYLEKNWLVVSTHLKNISQIGSSSPNRGENKKCLKPPPRKQCTKIPFGPIPSQHLESTFPCWDCVWKNYLMTGQPPPHPLSTPPQK